MTALLALLSSAVWGTADFLGGSLSRRLSPLVVVVVSQAVALLALIVLVLSTGAWHDDRGYVPWALCAGVLGMLLAGRVLPCAARREPWAWSPRSRRPG